MNTEDNTPQNAPLSTGERLRLAREQLGLDQAAVAHRLCLKVSTVRDIERNHISPDLATTFIRGYIRSYARLVNIPEEELLPDVDKQPPLKRPKITSFPGFPHSTHRKKRDRCLIWSTWLILIIVLGLTGAWWWQNHKIQQITIPAVPVSRNAVPVPINPAPAPVPVINNQPEKTERPATTATPIQPATTDEQMTSDSSLHASTVSTPPAAVTTVPSSPPRVENPAPVAHNLSAIDMHFTNDCWIEVTDSAGKILVTGLKKKNDRLSLSGTPPYQLKIGAPQAVQINYRGSIVDLSRFTRSAVARLTLGHVE